MQALSLDGLFEKQVRIWQHVDGYRFSIDAILLSVFSRKLAAEQTVVELGTGVGVISLGLAFPTPEAKNPSQIVALEIQERLAALAAKNVRDNALACPITVLRADLRKPPLRDGIAGLVVSNPPYFAVESSRTAPNEERALARSEHAATIADVLKAAARLSKPSGWLSLIYPVSQLPRLFAAMTDSPWQLAQLRFVYETSLQEASLAWVVARKRNGRGVPPLQILPPFFFHDPSGEAAAEYAQLLTKGY